MELLDIVGTAIRTLLLADPTVQALVDDRIYMTVAPAGSPLPYVTYWWTGGGFLNNAAGTPFDTYFIVTGVASNAAQAAEISSAIAGALTDVEPPFPSAWKAWSTITINTPFSERQNVQNEEYWRRGATFRFRGMIEN